MARFMKLGKGACREEIAQLLRKALIECGKRHFIHLVVEPDATNLKLHLCYESILGSRPLRQRTPLAISKAVEAIEEKIGRPNIPWTMFVHWDEHGIPSVIMRRPIPVQVGEELEAILRRRIA